MSAIRVLVVDDSGVTRALLVRTLQQAGYTTLEAADGAEAAVIALRELPDIVVTDIEMPTMDGYQLLHLLKSDPATAAVPIAVLTSHGEAPSRFWGLRTGADAYLTKDHAAGELVETVQRLAQNRGREHAVSGPGPRSPLEVLARVARQLDLNLFQATLANTLLERGMLADDFGAASEVVLVTISEVVDTPVLAVGIAEAHTVTVHVLLREPLAHPVVEEISSAIVERLRVHPGATVEVIVHGEENGQEKRPDLEPHFVPLQLRGADGILVLLPRDEQGFRDVSMPLIERVRPSLALVLDNARLSQRLRELSTLDSLTRLLNHRAIHERLAQELERARRYDHPLSVIICDLDHFKTVNDTHGHLSGDAVLRHAARRMQAHLRSADALGRYGGEEFLVVLPETDHESARRAAERLRLALADSSVVLPSNEVVTVTASFGVASRDEIETGLTADALVSLADSRLYEAKDLGRNCVRP